MSQRKKRTTTPPKYAFDLGVSVEKVYGWIEDGQLPAINISNGNVRPRYVITAEAIAEFERRRAAVTQSPKLKRIRRQRRPDVKQFV